MATERVAFALCPRGRVFFVQVKCKAVLVEIARVALSLLRMIAPIVVIDVRLIRKIAADCR